MNKESEDRDYGMLIFLLALLGLIVFLIIRPFWG